MLVLFSDLHITDETTARNVCSEAFSKILKDMIEKNAQKATQVHVVLLGDIFDLVRTDWWFRNKVESQNRPWNGELDPATGMNQNASLVESQFRAILADILKNKSSRALIDTLDALPSLTGKPVNVTYVLGNHDRVFNNFASLKAQVQAEFKNVQIEFKNELKAPEYGVFARHGHEWDKQCHGAEFAKVLRQGHGQTVTQFSQDAYKTMAIGEVVTAELMSGLVFYISEAMKDEGWTTAVDKDFLNNFKDINNLRPMVNVVFWLDWFTRNRYPKDKQKVCDDMVLEAARKAMSNVLESKLAQKWDRTEVDRLLWGDLTDKLQKIFWGLKFLKVDHLRHLISLWKSGMALFKSAHEADDELVIGGKKEWESLDRPFQYLVYGHTHQARHDYFEAHQDGTVKMYINTGTFLPLIELARDKRSFTASHQMTTAFFFKEDEDHESRADNGPTLTLWNGIRRKLYVRTPLHT